MKVRNGFVSNSSTSSFLIYGICFESEDEFREALNMEVENDDDDTDVWEIGYELGKELDMECLWPYDGDYGCYIGVSWDQVKDDETGAEFKARVEKKLKEKFGDDLEFSTYSEAWRDG